MINNKIDSFEFLLIKDPHFMFGFRNNIRKYGWEKFIDYKIDQIITYAKENNVSRVFFTGDVFEKSKKKEWSFNQLQENKKRLYKFKNEGIEVYSNLGNHDMFDGHENLEGTVFGEMVELGLIKYVGSGTTPYSFLIGGEFNLKNYIELYGIDHHQSIDVVLDNLKKISENNTESFKILLMHSNITDKQTRLTDFTYNQLSDYNINVIGCGHWHLAPEGGSIQTVNNTTFLNPWNLTRVMRDYHVKLDEHKPSFIHGSIVKVGKEFIPEFKEIQLDVLPFSEAFNTDIINILQEMGKDGFKFFEEIDLEQDEELNDDEILLNNLAKHYKISDNSVKIAKDLLS